MSEQGTSASTHLRPDIRPWGGVLKYNPVTIHPHPLGATMTRMQSAFHLRELPLGGQKTSSNLLCVCSSHPCRAVSLTQAWFSVAISVLLKPAACRMEAECNDSHTDTYTHIIKILHTLPSYSSTPPVVAAYTASLSNERTVILRPLKAESERTEEAGGRAGCCVK